MTTERKAAPNALWTYLLQKDLPASNDFAAATPMIPAVAPVDRTNTSMRMLIHDMQATLEKFSTRVDTLLTNVHDVKNEAVNFNRISENERERVLDEISNSSKKVQTELKACIGVPSQASALELVQKSQSLTENSIQALDKRIDAIQMLIQSQNYAMQAIQDQQHSILTAVLPLLPLTQAFPLHVDQLKTSIADNVSSSMSSLSRDIDGMKSTLSSLSAPSDTKRGVYQPALGLTPPRRSENSTRKRANSWLDRGDTVPGPSQTSRTHSFAPMHSPRIDRHKKPRLDSILPTGSPQLMRQTSHTANPPEKYALDLCGSSNADGLVSPARGLVTNNGYPAAPRPKHSTRTPLADILPSALVDNATASPKPVNSVPSSANEKYRKRTTESPPRVLPIPPQPISKAIKLEEALRSPLRCYISIPPSPLSSLSPSPSPVPAQSVLKNQVHHATGGTARRQVTFAAPSQVFASSTLPSPAIPSLPTLDSMSASMSLRDRRAQMSMLGRTASSVKRFIPLGSSSDEEG